MSRTTTPGRPTPIEALLRLWEGNRRFVSGTTIYAHESAVWRKQLVGAQHPFATILGCSDSRVPVELVFDQGFGDLFVVRVAGNVVAPDVTGSLAYAVAHLQTPLVVVLGHEGCGAVTAGLRRLDGFHDEPPAVEQLLDLLEPGLRRATLPAGPPDQRLAAAVEANVGWSMRQLFSIPMGRQLIEEGRIMLVGAVYELTTGRVRWLEPDPSLMPRVPLPWRGVSDLR